MGSSYITAVPRCPLCGRKVYWSCTGSTGWAHCSKSIYAVRELGDRTFCTWKGRVVRKSNGSVCFVIEGD